MCLALCGMHQGIISFRLQIQLRQVLLSLLNRGREWNIEDARSYING